LHSINNVDVVFFGKILANDNILILIVSGLDISPATFDVIDRSLSNMSEVANFSHFDLTADDLDDQILVCGQMFK
jgi:hypothetical protein